MKKQLLRRLAALSLALVSLWTAVFATYNDSFASADDSLTDLTAIYTAMVRWELGDFFRTDLLSALNILALQQSPFLLYHRNPVTALMAQALPDIPQENVDTSTQAPPTASPSVDNRVALGVGGDHSL